MNNQLLLKKLQNEFEAFRGQTLTTTNMKKIKVLLAKLDNEWVTKLAEADIPWVSLTAECMLEKQMKFEQDQIDRETARRLLFK
jgi:hypothetical protein